jgi:hypothetical protein
MQRRTREAPGRRRYAAGDTVKLRVVVDHKPHLKEVRLVFAHEDDEHTMIMATVEPPSGSDTATDDSMRSSLEADITIPRGRRPGVYRLDRIGYETAGGRLGHLSAGEGLPEGSLLAFEVTREPVRAILGRPPLCYRQAMERALG